MGTLRDRVDYWHQSISRWSVAVTSTVTVTLETSKSNFALCRPALRKAKQCPWSCTNNMPFPKIEKKVTSWPNLAPSLVEKPVVIWMGVTNLCIWGGGVTVHMCGLNSGFACLSFSIKSPLYWRAKAGKAVRCGAGVPSSLPTFFRLQRHLVAFFQPLHTAHPSLLRGHSNPFLWCLSQAFFRCNLICYYERKLTPPFLKSLSSEETSEQICRLCPHIPVL